MKKFSLSSCLTKLGLSVIIVVGFVYGFSLLFPRAYNVLEAKALGIEEDSTVTVVNATKSPPQTDTTKVLKQVPNEFKVAVKLECSGNCYYIPTKVNGIPMKMLLDTGASTLTISIVEYEFMKKQGLLKDSTVEETHATIANGADVKCYNIKIDEVTIGDVTIKDVDCIVMEQGDAPVLLGMNVLRKFGHFSIDYEKNLLIIKK